jgi:uncharacterized protein YcgL (UPF0745 family)
LTTTTPTYQGNNTQRYIKRKSQYNPKPGKVVAAPSRPQLTSNIPASLKRKLFSTTAKQVRKSKKQQIYLTSSEEDNYEDDEEMRLNSDGFEDQPIEDNTFDHGLDLMKRKMKMKTMDELR